MKFHFNRKVSTTQEELHKVQHERVGVQLKITQSQDSLTSLNVELQDCRRGDPKYLEMIKKVRNSIVSSQ